MKCQNCLGEFIDSELQLSHDVPKYIGGQDKDGRHYLCKKCHDIYERLVFYKISIYLDEDIKEKIRIKIKEFAKSFFRRGGEDGEI